jgi:hypothetical protein
MISPSLKPSPASETSALNKIWAFISALAPYLPLRNLASRCARSSPVKRTTYRFTPIATRASFASRGSINGGSEQDIQLGGSAYSNSLKRPTRVARI